MDRLMLPHDRAQELNVAAWREGIHELRLAAQHTQADGRCLDAKHSTEYEEGSAPCSPGLTGTNGASGVGAVLGALSALVVLGTSRGSRLPYRYRREA